MHHAVPVVVMLLLVTGSLHEHETLATLLDRVRTVKGVTSCSNASIVQ